MAEKKKLVIDEKTPLLIIAGPMFMELFLNIFLNNVDTMMLSHYSEFAVGSVGNANQVMFLMIIMFNIIATATSVVVAQYLGAKQYDRMNMIYTLALTVNLVMLFQGHQAAEPEQPGHDAAHDPVHDLCHSADQALRQKGAVLLALPGKLRGGYDSGLRPHLQSLSLDRSAICQWCVYGPVQPADVGSDR